MQERETAQAMKAQEEEGQEQEHVPSMEGPEAELETEEAPSEVPIREEPRKRTDGNVVYIGKKGTMGYVLAIVTQFNNGAQEVVVKARGKLISRAVDVAEIVRHRFLPNSQVSSIAISTEELTSEDGSRNKVSAIEIRIQK